MKIGDRVRLIAFNGKLRLKRVRFSENYWKLIGETGTVQKDPQEKYIYASFSEKPRVLVKFDRDVTTSYGLIAHNNIENSLWILVSDLEILQ
jgi:hypothetical protein